MKVGDLVSVWQRYHWGGLSGPICNGILLKRTYLGYDNNQSDWLVMTPDGPEVVKQSNLSKMENTDD